MGRGGGGVGLHNLPYNMNADMTHGSYSSVITKFREFSRLVWPFIQDLAPDTDIFLWWNHKTNYT